jgi:hypothetical protein
MSTQQSSAASGAQRLLEMKAKAEEILRIGVKRGIVSEYTQITILPGWTARYAKLSSDEQAALRQHNGFPTPLAYGAALKLAGAMFSKKDIDDAFIAEVTKGLGEHVQETEKPTGRPELIDTPEARAEALRAMGINV